MLARRVAGPGALSYRVVADFAFAHPGHRCPRGLGPHQRALPAPRAAASRTTRHLEGSLFLRRGNC